jgi:hypothetical protein
MNAGWRVHCVVIAFDRDFLPRGTGIVTRRPLELQLCNIPKVQAERSGLDEGGALRFADMPV